jgi:hypothetical protein
MLELPNVYYMENFAASMLFPKHVVVLVEEFFLKPEDESKPKGWNVVLIVR